MYTLIKRPARTSGFFAGGRTVSGFRSTIPSSVAEDDRLPSAVLPAAAALWRPAACTPGRLFPPGYPTASYYNLLGLAAAGSLAAGSAAAAVTLPTFTFNPFTSATLTSASQMLQQHQQQPDSSPTTTPVHYAHRFHPYLNPTPPKRLHADSPPVPLH
jgi:hypothetical protein